VRAMGRKATYDCETNCSACEAAFEGGIVVGCFFFFGKDFHSGGKFSDILNACRSWCIYLIEPQLSSARFGCESLWSAIKSLRILVVLTYDVVFQNFKLGNSSVLTMI